MSIAVLLELQVKPESESVGDMKAYLKEILPDTRAYDGCEGLDVYGNMDDTGNLVLYELWASRPQYEKYLGWRSETGVVDKLGSMLAGPPSIRYFDPVDA